VTHSAPFAPRLTETVAKGQYDNLLTWPAVGRIQRLSIATSGCRARGATFHDRWWGALTSSVPRPAAAAIGPTENGGANEGSADAGSVAAAPESDVTAHPTQGRRAAAAVVPLCYLLAAVLLTWRLWVDPASRIVAGNARDADLFAWFMRYAATAVQHGHLPALVTTGMNAPTGINMMWNTPVLLPAVLLAPVTLLAGPQVSLTILTTLGFAGSATALFCVLRRWDVSIEAAALAGAVYGFSPALLQTAIAHYDLQLAMLLPLIVDAGVRLAVGPRVAAASPAGSRFRWLARVPAWAPAGAWLGLLLAAQIFVGEELALTTALTTALVVLVLAVSRPRSAIRRVGPAAAGLVVAAVIALALTGSALWTQFRGPLIVHGSSHPLDVFVNDLTSFVTPQGTLLFHTAASAAAAASYQGGMPEYLGYLGWPLIAILAVAAVASWRRLAGRAAAITLVVLSAMSLGGHPLIAGTLYPAVNLPWHWVEVVPVFSAILTDRLSILADGAAAVLLAVGIDDVRARLAARRPALGDGDPMPRRRDQVARLAVLALAVACCLPLLPRALPTARTMPLPAGWSAVFARLHLAQGSRVLVLPFPRPGITLPLRWSAESGKPSSMTGGYFIGPGVDGKARLGPQVPRRIPFYLDYLWSQGVPRSSPYRAEAAIAHGQWTGAGWPAVHTSLALTELASWRPQAVVADANAASPLGQYLAELLGPPSVRVGGLIGWRVGAVTGPPQPSSLPG
jgi:hypothetical protein